MKSAIFWDITPYSSFKVNRRFGGPYRLHLQGRRISRARYQSESRWQASLCLPPAFTLVSCSAYSPTLKMEAICSSEMSVNFQRTTRRYIPEDSTLHNHCCENLKSYRGILYCLLKLIIKLFAYLQSFAEHSFGIIIPITFIWYYIIMTCVCSTCFYLFFILGLLHLRDRNQLFSRALTASRCNFHWTHVRL
jgi:hypothetical protein